MERNVHNLKNKQRSQFFSMFYLTANVVTVLLTTNVGYFFKVDD